MESLRVWPLTNFATDVCTSMRILLYKFYRSKRSMELWLENAQYSKSVIECLGVETPCPDAVYYCCRRTATHWIRMRGTPTCMLSTSATARPVPSPWDSTITIRTHWITPIRCRPLLSVWMQYASAPHTPNMSSCLCLCPVHEVSLLICCYSPWEGNCVQILHKI